MVCGTHSVPYMAVLYFLNKNQWRQTPLMIDWRVVLWLHINISVLAVEKHT